jgi:O-antigen/teichoic acid export membrane protein
VGTIVPGVLAFAGVIVFIRVFGAAEYGRYSVASGIAGSAGGYATGWLAQGLLRYRGDIASRRASVEHDRVLFTAGIAAMLAVLLIGVLFRESVRGIASLTAFTAMLMAFYQVFSASVQADLAARRLAAAEILRAAALVALPLILVVTHTAALSASTLMMGVVASYVAASLFLRPTFRPLAVTGPAQHLGMIWSYGWPVGMWLGTSQLMTYADRYVLAHLMGYQAAGEYAALADMIRKGFMLVLAPVTLSVHPLVMRAWSDGDSSGARALLDGAMRIQIAFCIGAIAIVTVLSHLIRSMIPGAPIGVVIPLAIGSAGWSLAMIAHKPLELLQRTRRMLIWIITAATLTIVAMIWAVPRFGFAGAAWSSSLGAFLYLLSVTADGRKQMKDHR